MRRGDEEGGSGIRAIKIINDDKLWFKKLCPKDSVGEDTDR